MHTQVPLTHSYTCVRLKCLKCLKYDANTMHLHTVSLSHLESIVVRHGLVSTASQVWIVTTEQTHGIRLHPYPDAAAAIVSPQIGRHSTVFLVCLL